MTYSKSIYERLYNSDELPKQRFVCTFSGDSLNPRWTLECLNGTGSATMRDAVCGGLVVASGNCNNNYTQIFFNDIRPFCEEGVVQITIATKPENCMRRMKIGLARCPDITSNDDFAQFLSATGCMDFRFGTDDCTGTATTTNTGVLYDANPHIFKIELFSASAEADIDGILRVTNTTNLPTVALQPYFATTRQGCSGTTENYINYMEVYNT